jgi:CBS domain containing-hemolysin-like protein
VPALQLLIALLLIAANAFFVAAEFSLARLRPTQVEGWVRERRPGATAVEHALGRIDAYLAACQLGITVASLGLGVLGERAFERLLAPLLGDHARIGSIGLAAALAFLLITVLHVVLGELSPKSVAIARTERVALIVAPPMRVFYQLTRPLVDLFNGLGNLVLKPFGIPPAREAGHAPHSEDELRSLVAESGREGLIEPEERQFTDNVFTFGDRRAEEVMVPRPAVRFVTTDDDFDGAVELIRETGLTRLPLCGPEQGLDDGVGLLHAKDLLVAPDRSLPLLELARPLERIPDTMLLDEVLELFRTRQEHLAVVVDEHGTAVGAITLEDVLEQIVGGIEDEFDRPPAPHVELRGDEASVPGETPVHAVEAAFAVDLDAHEATIGGHLVERLGRLPEVGETVRLGPLALTADRVGEALVEQVTVRRAERST